MTQPGPDASGPCAEVFAAIDADLDALPAQSLDRRVALLEAVSMALADALAATVVTDGPQSRSRDR